VCYYQGYTNNDADQSFTFSLIDSGKISTDNKCKCPLLNVFICTKCYFRWDISYFKPLWVSFSMLLDLKVWISMYTAKTNHWKQVASSGSCSANRLENTTTIGCRSAVPKLLKKDGLFATMTCLATWKKPHSQYSIVCAFNYNASRLNKRDTWVVLFSVLKNIHLCSLFVVFVFVFMFQ
jgi:hypothetical protein